MRSSKGRETRSANSRPRRAVSGQSRCSCLRQGGQTTGQIAGTWNGSEVKAPDSDPGELISRPMLMPAGVVVPGS